MSQLRSAQSNRTLPPGSYGLPFIGQTLAWERNPLEYLCRRYQRYGSIFKSRIYGHREITMLGPEANKFILSSHRDHFEWGKAHEVFFNKKLFGVNLFVLDGEAHDHLLQFIFPAFHGKALKGYVTITSDLARTYADRWTTMPNIVTWGEVRKLTFEIAARLLLGADTRAQVEQLSYWCQTLSHGVHAFALWDLPWTRFGRALRALHNLRQYFHALLQQRRREPREDILGMMLTATDVGGKPLTDDEIVAHLLTLVMAAHDTSTSSLTWMMYELYRHPETIVRLRAELANVTNGGAVSFEHIPQLRYLDCVVKEVERLHPPVTGGPRTVVKPFEFEGYYVPAGSLVYYSILFTHMMPEVFANPEQFDPDRFAPPRKEDEHTPFSLIGFGGGPRSCIGRGLARLEMKIICSVLLREYEWNVLPDQDLRGRYTPTKCPKDGLLIQFRKKGD